MQSTNVNVYIGIAHLLLGTVITKFLFLSPTTLYHCHQDYFINISWIHTRLDFKIIIKCILSEHTVSFILSVITVLNITWAQMHVITFMPIFSILSFFKEEKYKLMRHECCICPHLSTLKTIYQLPWHLFSCYVTWCHPNITLLITFNQQNQHNRHKNL